MFLQQHTWSFYLCLKMSTISMRHPAATFFFFLPKSDVNHSTLHCSVFVWTSQTVNLSVDKVLTDYWETPLRSKRPPHGIKTLRPADGEGRAVWFTSTELVQMSRGFNFRLEWGQNLTNWQLTNGLPAFIGLGKETRMPPDFLQPPHTNSERERARDRQINTHMPIKLMKRGWTVVIFTRLLDSGLHILKLIYDRLCFSYGFVSIQVCHKFVIVSSNRQVITLGQGNIEGNERGCRGFWVIQFSQSWTEAEKD